MVIFTVNSYKLLVVKVCVSVSSMDVVLETTVLVSRALNTDFMQSWYRSWS